MFRMQQNRKRNREYFYFYPRRINHYIALSQGMNFYLYVFLYSLRILMVILNKKKASRVVFTGDSVRQMVVISN